MVSTRVEKNKLQRKNIAKEEHIENTKEVSKKLFKVFLILFIIFGSIYVICRYIGTSGLIVKEYSLEYDNLPDSFYGLKIIQISDVNYNKKTMNMKKVERMIDKVNSIRPDIIIFTGNLIYGDATLEELTSLEELFNNLDASLGKYAVFGDDNDQAKIIMKNSGFIDLENTYDLIYKDEYKPILITGINSDYPDYDEMFSYFDSENANNDIFTISIMHKPDSIDGILDYHPVDLAMAGYSLNGLIQLPKVGGLFLKDGCRNYYDSYYKINETDFYISSGLGTRELPYRLFNHPSINLYRIK